MISASVFFLSMDGLDLVFVWDFLADFAPGITIVVLGMGWDIHLEF